MRPDVQMLDLLVNALLDVRARLDPINRQSLDRSLDQTLMRRATDIAHTEKRKAVA